MNRISLTYKLLSIAILFFMLGSCLEEITVKTEDFESLLVIEARITNENRQQKIMLSRTFQLEENGPVQETNASVSVIGENNTYIFTETEPGIYISNASFAAKPNVDYQLLINTTSGKSYSSNLVQLTQNTQINNLYVERGFNEKGEEGVSIFVDSNDPSNNSNYYRFEYEETYKIIAPLYSPKELEVVNRAFPIPDSVVFFGIQDYFVELVDRKHQKQICYNTVKSNKIIITNTNNLDEDRLEKYRVRFISRENYIITHRYSILVKQFVQSREAFTYYETLNNISDSESLLSETQPGFLTGNISSVSDLQEKVIGFFEVSSVDIKRVYFNYADLFPNETIPPFAISCNILNAITPALWNTDPGHPTLALSSPLVSSIDLGFQYYDVNINDTEAPYPYRPFILVPEECGDCTALGSTNLPSFWED